MTTMMMTRVRDDQQLLAQLTALRAAGLTQRDYERLLDAPIAGTPSGPTREVGREYRAARMDIAEVNRESRTIPISFSSDAAVERWWGIEILDHSPGAIRTERSRNGLPLLLIHDAYRDPQNLVGRVEEVTYSDGRTGRGNARFGSGERAEWALQNCLGKVLTDTSVGYQIHHLVLVEERDDGPSVYRASDWEPLEVSLVPVPADITVGAGRSLDSSPKGARMSDEGTGVQTAPAAPAAPVVDVTRARRAIADAEIARIDQIRAIGERLQMDELSREFINSHKSVDDFRAAAIEKMGSASPLRPVRESAEIGLTGGQAESFSFMRLLDCLANPGDNQARKAAGFELDACRAADQKHAPRMSGTRIPHDVLAHLPVRAMAQRDLMANAQATGGAWVASTLMPGSFIEMLRNKMALKALGAQVMDGLVGDIILPKQTGGATAYWVGEARSVTKSNLTTGTVELKLKSVAGVTKPSRQFLKQSSIGAETFLRNDLEQVLAIASDLAGIAGGGGAHTPLGILYQTGIGSVAGGTDGAAPTYDHILQLEKEVAVDNAMAGAIAYLTNPKVVYKLKLAKTNATYGEIPVWLTNPQDPTTGVCNGTRAMWSNQVPSNLTKGSSTLVCSPIVYGNFNDMIIAGWGGIEFVVDPYSESDDGLVKITAYLDTDVAVRHVESFAAMLDATTT
jgi:HK97 family phage major capsid protein